MMMMMVVRRSTGGETGRARGARCQRPAGGKTQIRSFHVNYVKYDDDDDDDVDCRNDGDNDNDGRHNA